MLYTISPADMQHLEKEYMAQYAVPGALLMEYAATAVCNAVSRHTAPDSTAHFLCGPGNNGGDGYAAARLWQQRGGKSIIIELTDCLRGDALMNRRLAEQCRIQILPADSITMFPDHDVIVDALFGTGLARAPEGTALMLIRLANASQNPVIAVDIPSGLSGLDGSIPGEAVRADETVTFHRSKLGLYLGQGADYTGTVTTAPILIPDSYGNADGMALITKEDLSRLLPRRPRRAHKGTFGKTVIFAGSFGMAGAAALSIFFGYASVTINNNAINHISIYFNN